MESPNMHIVCVGAVYIDTIWQVPYFPKEDTKLRAENITRRRGGNTANTLEVLSDILAHAAPLSPSINLHLIAVLPELQSQDTQYIRASIQNVDVAGLFRSGHQHAASSMIIQSRRDGTRTIVSHGGGLQEMSCEEWVSKFRATVPNAPADADGAGRKVWVHFEGRVPEVTNECVRELRHMEGYEDAVISVECEKPDRKGLDDAAAMADVVFYSKLWAEEIYGDSDPTMFLEKQIHRLKFSRRNAILICTWGASGAAAVRLDDTPDAMEWARCSDTWHPPDNPGAKVVDTVGAGDTFIAGMLYSLTNRPKAALAQNLQYAVELASRKVYQDGFSGLGEAMHAA
ncbi:Ribokinase-like protein [Phaeosphaeria sp. MPI-PUGE-AT-0046c]|nr:Ribokinase-like protein [Phaeosphaeria sp. MPI-PUGE-AT-0046c]